MDLPSLGVYFYLCNTWVKALPIGLEKKPLSRLMVFSSVAIRACLSYEGDHTWCHPTSSPAPVPATCQIRDLCWMSKWWPEWIVQNCCCTEWSSNYSVFHDTYAHRARFIWKSFLEVGGLGTRFLNDFVNISLSFYQESWPLLSGNWKQSISSWWSPILIYSPSKSFKNNHICSDDKEGREACTNEGRAAWVR